MPIAWGLNCGSGPDGLLGAVEAAVAVCSLPLIVQPNAGMPKEVENRRIYFCSPEYLTSYAKRYVEPGGLGGGRMLRHDARAYPRDRPGGQAAGPARRRQRGAGRSRRRRKSRPPSPANRGWPAGWPSGNGWRPWNSCRRAATT